VTKKKKERVKKIFSYHFFESKNEKNLLGKNTPAYDDEIFDVLHNDKKAIIRFGNQNSLQKTNSYRYGCAIANGSLSSPPLLKK